MPRRRLWVKARTTSDGVHVEYAGLARGEDPAWARAGDELAARHAQTLGVTLLVELILLATAVATLLPVRTLKELAQTTAEP